MVHNYNAQGGTVLTKVHLKIFKVTFFLGEIYTFKVTPMTLGWVTRSLLS